MLKSRRTFIKGVPTSIAGISMMAGKAAHAAEVMKAGFARVKITPPVGTKMTGFPFRDHDPVGSKGVHDDLYARALFLSNGNKRVLIMAFDLLFFSRDEADRYKGAIGRKIDLSPSQILLNTSHTHTGPKVGTWYYTPSDRLYLQFLENAIVQAAYEAQTSTREVTIWTGETQTKMPMNRRKPLPNGVIDFAPNPNGVIYDKLPIVLIKDTNNKPLYLLFSTSCHPSTIKVGDLSYYFSADFPGAAVARLDNYLGNTGSLFLLGAAGDSKARVIGEGEEQWRAGVWDDVEKAGKILADEVIEGIKKGLKPVTPELCTRTIEMEWPMIELPTQKDLEMILANPHAHSESYPEDMKLWAEEKLEMLKRGYTLPSVIPITAHGVKLGKGCRLIGIEGEIVAEYGLLIRNFYNSGVTFPMGYTDGAQLYLTTSKQIDEGGYEVESYWEYRHPARLAKGGETILLKTLEQLKAQGID